MQFLLGTHRPSWVAKTDVPLFLSRRTICKGQPKRAIGDWALDSGGFSELFMFGKWETSPQQYVDEVRAWADQIGGMKWAAIQDWMCEPFILAKTGKTVRDHQLLTVQSFLTLKSLAPEIHWVPVLQGWRVDDYLAHVEMYNRALPWPLQKFRLVGVGSVCRRQATQEAVEILRALHGEGLKLHGFGFKISGLRDAAPYLKSADSMAWSRAARYSAPLPGCTHRQCNNCIRYALKWRQKVLRMIELGMSSYQPCMF